MNRLKKLLPWLLLGGLIVGVVGSYLFRNQDDRFPAASVGVINRGLDSWYRRDLRDYQLVMDIEFAGNTRRQVIVVRDGQAVSGSVSYREGLKWTEPDPWDVNSAAAWTVPALFENVRSAIQQNQREFVRMQLSESADYPEIIILGPILIDGFPESDTETRIRIIELISPDDT